MVLRILVAKLVEMVSNRIFEVFTRYVVEMSLESIHKSTFCLSNVLDFTDFACDTV